MKIRELSISARAKVCLLTAGYEELEDLKDITDEELLEIRNLNAKGVAEIREKIEEYFAEENMNMYDEAMKIAIDELEFSERTYNCLKRAGINTLEDLCDRMWDDMIHVQNLGKKGFEEILFKISSLGYSFKDEQRADIYDYPMFKELLSMPIADMNISQRTKDVLSQNGIDIVKELCCCSENQVRSFQNISQDDITDLNSAMSSLSIFYRPEIIDEFMYLYPKYCKDLASGTIDAWENRLYIEAFITNYEWLVELRTKEVRLWQYTDEDCCIDNYEKYAVFMNENIKKYNEIIEAIVAIMPAEVDKALDVTKENGDAGVIVNVAEKLTSTYKDLLKQKIAFEKVDADEQYRNVIEQWHIYITGLCRAFDDLYNKMLIAKDQISDYIAGKNYEESLALDYSLRYTPDRDSLRGAIDDLNKAEWDLLDFEDSYEDEFEDIAIFQCNEKIGVTVEFCGLEFDAVSETITINIWVNSESEDTYDIWIKDLYINGKQHKEYSNIGEISDYDSGYMEEVIDDNADVSYEEIRTIKFLVEIDDENDNELANSKVITVSCNVCNETFSVESIEDYECDVDIIEDGEDYLDSRDISLDELEFSVRTYNCLKRAGILSLGDICEKTMEDMTHIRNFGRKSLEEVLRKLEEYDLSLKDPEEEEVATNTNSESEELLGKDIDEMELSIRSYNCLKRAGINTIGDLCSKSFEDMMRVRNLGRKSLEEVIDRLNYLGLLLSEHDDPLYFLASYPENIKDIPRKKGAAWEYRLFIETVIYKYDSLNSYRNQRVVFWEHEDNLNRIESIGEFDNFIQLQLRKLNEFMHKIADCIRRDLKEFIDAPGEVGDVQKIIAVTEKLMQIYKDMIAWKLSFGDIDADYMYRKVIEQFCPMVDSVLKNIDILYEKFQVDKKQFEDLLAGRITDKELNVGGEFTFTLECNIDGFKKAYDKWTLKTKGMLYLKN